MQTQAGSDKLCWHLHILVTLVLSLTLEALCSVIPYYTDMEAGVEKVPKYPEIIPCKIKNMYC